MTPNIFIYGIIIVSIFAVGYSFYQLIKDLMPPKPPKHNEKELDRKIIEKISGSKYSTKEDIRKRHDEIKDFEQ